MGARARTVVLVVVAVAAALVATLSHPVTARATSGISGNAQLELGQPINGGAEWTDTKNGPRSNLGLDAPTGVAVDSSGHVVIADQASNRVAAFTGAPTNGQAFDRVFGHTTTTDYRDGCSSSTLSGPEQVSIAVGASIRMAAVDAYNHRVMLWSMPSWPAGSGTAATSVVGEPNATTCPNGGATSQSLVNAPEGVWTDGTKLLVADTGNNRVLVWNTWPTAGQNADFVIGQATFTASGSGATATTMSGPVSVWSNGTKILVADSLNDRVLTYDAWPTGNGMAATHVLGAASTGVAGTGGCSTKAMSFPTGVGSNGTRIVVSDTDNGRAMTWDAWPTGDNGAATHVLGDSSTSACNGDNRGGTTVTSGTLAGPGQAFTDGTQVLVADTRNNRVLKWSSWPTTDGPAATTVVGHSLFTTAGPYDHDRASSNAFRMDDDPSAQNLKYLVAPFVVPSTGALLVANGVYNKVDYWGTAPSTNDAKATWRFGQLTDDQAFDTGPDLTTTATTLGSSTSVWSDGTRMLVSDENSHRVKVWSTFPTSTNQAPNWVIGQASLTAAATGAASQTKVPTPAGVVSDGTHVAVADRASNRILLWDTFPTSNNQPADHVLGQSNFTNVSANNGGTRTAATLSKPTALAMWNGKLAVADFANARILVWNSWPTSNLQAADVVVGATSGTVVGAYTDARAVTMSDNTLAYADDCGAAFLDPIPTANTAALGTSVGAGGACSGTPVQNKVGMVDGVSLDKGKLYVADVQHARVVRFDDTAVPTLASGPSTVAGCIGTTVTWSTDESGTTELYWDATSHGAGGALVAYASNSIDSNITGLSHAATATGLTPGATYYYKIRTLDGAGNAMATSTEYSFVAGSTLPVSTGLFTSDASAQTSATKPVDISVATPRFSWTNGSGCTVDRQRVKVESDLLDANVVGLWHMDSSMASVGSTTTPIVLGTAGNAPANPLRSSASSALDRALYFDGNDRASVVDSAAIDRATTFSVEAWFRADDVTVAALPNAVNTIIRHGANCNGAPDCNYNIYLDRSGSKLQVQVSSGGVLKYVNTPLVPLLDGHWHQVAATVDATAVVRLYVDGALAATGSSLGTVDTGTSPMWIGSAFGTSNYFRGSIDEVRYSNSIRTLAEIHGDFERRQPHATVLGDSDPTDTGVALATCANAARCADVTYAATGTSSPLTGGRYTVESKVRSGTGAWSLWMNDTFEMDTGRPINLYTDPVDASAGYANRTAISAVAPHFSWINTANSAVDRQRTQVITTPLDDVQALWHLDGNGTDATGSGNALTPAGSTWASAPAAFGGASGALHTNGSTYATVPSTPSLTAGNDFTIEAWFRTTTISNIAYPILVHKSVGTGGCNSSGACQYSIEFERATNRISLALSSGATEYDVYAPAAGLVDGNWHHVAGTMDAANTMNLYVDGVLVGSTPVGAPANTCSCSIKFGNNTSGGNGFIGDVDDVRYSSVARTAGEIAGYYRTHRPHATVMWDSDPGQAGTATFTSCADLARCPDVTYGATGTAPLDLVHDGARYYVRSMFRNAALVWGDWASWDWFESMTTLSFALTSTPTVNLGATLPLSDTTGTSTMTVTTNNATGWSLSATNASDTAGMTGGGTFPAWSGTPATPTNWPAGTGGGFGVTLVSSTAGKDTSRWGTGTAETQFATTNWAGPKLTTPTALADRQTYSGGTDTIVAGYRADAPAAQAPGAYATTVTYTAVANP